MGLDSQPSEQQGYLGLTGVEIERWDALPMVTQLVSGRERVQVQGAWLQCPALLYDPLRISLDNKAL
jgi:hypothetical protein